MKIKELRHFILRTRQKEGVNWFLTDMTPSAVHKGHLFHLYCYDGSGTVVRVVTNIEERNGSQIPYAKLVEIERARTHCGINQYYLNRKGSASREERLAKFEGLRDEWPNQIWADLYSED